jgi:glycosyltransferase involved in cell wall biosynthesis
MPKRPLISFIICTFNRAGYLNDTLQSILQTNAPPGQFEILIVDNNSTDETPSVFQSARKKFPATCINYVKETQQGLSYARNRGIDESAAPYVVFLDDDIRAAPSLIPAWISFFSHHSEPAAGGGKIRVQFDAPRPDWMSRFLLPLLGHHDLGKNPKKYPANKYPFGGNMGFNKKIFSKIGGFNPALGRKGASLNAGEEKELFRRLRKKEYDIYYLPDAFLYHRVNGNRLTISFIKKQAAGLGQSMNLRLSEASSLQKVTTGFAEIGKLLASLPLALAYLLQWNPAKAGLLLKFRWWIWKEYFNYEPQKYENTKIYHSC